MSRRPCPAVAAAVAALSLLLAACGGDAEEPQRDDKSAGAQDDGPPSPSQPEEAAEGRPEITLPKDITYAFEWSKTGDPDKDAVVRDGEQLIKAIDVAIAEQDPTHGAVLFYTEGEAAAEAERFIQGYVDDEDRTTGRYRFYNELVQVAEDGTATLRYCEDQSKAYAKSLQSGKVYVTDPSADDYVVYSAKMRKDGNGVWVTEQIVSERGAAQCQP